METLSPEQIARFVEGACKPGEREKIERLLAESADLRARVEQAREDRAWWSNEQAAVAAHLPDAESGNQPVQTASSSGGWPRIQGYELVRELGSGGQGCVYQATQATPRRSVAIKVMRQIGGRPAAARRRFEREIELVGRMRHPGIVPIFHSGLTDDRRPFYVMDYIRGVRLDRYVRDRKLPLEETLELFAKVCDAVQYAHQRGVIHRDLKPSNIIVDAEGIPRILDFGLAKWLAAPVDSVASLTEQVVGTVPYMAPEQARGTAEEVDTRTDVYALGVMLYELLTGHYPYPMDGPLFEALQEITQTDPAPLTQRWDAESGVTRRRTGRSRTCPIDDEVQTIVLKALSKERARRYQSAGEFSRDIGHYLAGEPIEAKRDSGWYLLRKTARRHRKAAFVGVGYLVLITSFAVMTAWQALELAAERDRAQAARQQAEDEADKSRFLGSTVQNLLETANPNSGFEGSEEVREFMVDRFLKDAAGEVMNGPLAERPLLQASAVRQVGEYYLALDRKQEAEPLLMRAFNTHLTRLGEYDIETAHSLLELGRLRAAQRQLDEAYDLFARARAAYTAVDGPRSLAVAEVLTDWGAALNVANDAEAAEPVLLEALEIWQGRPDADPGLAAEIYNNLATSAYLNRDFAQARQRFEQAAEVFRTAYGTSDWRLPKSLDNLGVILTRTGKLSQAEEVFREALELRRGLYGDEHPAVFHTLANLARLLRNLKQDDEAEQLLVEALEGSRAYYGEASVQTLTPLGNLAALYGALDRYEDAEPLRRAAVKVARKAVPEKDDEARARSDKITLANQLVLHGHCLLKLERFAEAEDVLRECLNLRSRDLDPTHWYIGSTRAKLGAALTGLKRFEEAEATLLAAHEQLAANGKTPRSQIIAAAQRLAELYEAWGREPQAAEWRAGAGPED